MNRTRWYGLLIERWDTLRSSYWFLPALMALVSGVLAVATVELDRRELPGWLAAVPWLTRVSAEGARAVLSTIAGSMMTVTGVVFSITVVALTLTSSQFGPRLLRTFFRDRASQLSLGTFLSTFCYSLLVLRAVESPEQVPTVATACAVLLAVISLFVLIFFIHHTASSLQASSVIASVACEIRDQIPVLFPETLGEAGPTPPSARDQERLDELAANGADVASTRDGYVRVIDEGRLLQLARERDLLVRIEARPGRFVARGVRLARILPSARVDADVEARVRDCCILGDHRTPVQDVCFLIEQLSEMAVRALSPGVNDPKTAVECVHRIGAVIGELSQRAFPSGYRLDAEGTLRVSVAPTRFESVAASAFDAIRRHGASNPPVAIALLEAIATAAGPDVTPERRRLLLGHAREIHGAFERSSQHRSDRDRELVVAAFDRARQAAED